LVSSAALAVTCALLSAVAKPAYSQPIDAAYANIAIDGDGVSVTIERPAMYTIGCEPLTVLGPVHRGAAAFARGKKIEPAE